MCLKIRLIDLPLVMREHQKEYLRLQDAGSKASGYSSMPLHLSGGGGLVSTTEDYYNFCQMLLNGGSFGGKRLYQEKLLN